MSIVENLLNNVDWLILSAAFLSLLVTLVVGKVTKGTKDPHPVVGHMTPTVLMMTILTALLFLTWITVGVSSRA